MQEGKGFVSLCIHDLGDKRMKKPLPIGIQTAEDILAQALLVVLCGFRV